jgi:hypothetical protein
MGEHTDDDHHDERAKGGQRHPPADHRVDATRRRVDLTDLGEALGLCLGRV